MATFTDTIRILIQADGAKAVGELEKVGKTSQRELDRADKATRNWSATFTRAGVGLTTFAAVAGAGLYSAAQAADEAQQAQLRLDNTIANSPRLTERSARAFRDLASALMAKTVVDDDAIVSSQALLGQFGLTEDQILSLTPLVVDLSRKMGVDLDSASKAVAKAVNGSGTALTRMGIQVKAGADGVVDFTDVMGALSSRVGGFAEQEAKTFTGQIEQMKNQLGEVAENVGGGVIPVFQGMIAPLKAVSEGFAALPSGVQSTVGSILGLGVAASGAVGGISLLAGKLSSLRAIALVDPTAGLAGGLTGIGKAMGVAGIATVALGGIFSAFANDSADAAEQAEALAQSVQNVTSAMNSGQTLGTALLNELRNVLQTSPEVKDALDDIGVSSTDFFAAIQNGGSDAEDILRRLSAVASEGSFGGRALTSDAEAADEARKAFVRLLGTYLQAQRGAAALNATQDDLAGAQRDGTRVAGEFADETDAAGRATDRTSGRVRAAGGDHRSLVAAIKENEAALSSLIGEIDRYQDRLKGNRDSSRDAALAQLDAADAVQQVADAQKAYNDTVAEYGPNSAEAAAAQRELQRAVIGAYQAQDDATQALLDNAAAQAGYDRGAGNNAKSTQRYVAELVKARNETSGPTRDALNQHIAKILGIPEEKATEMTLPEIRARLRELKEHKDGIDRVPKEKKTKVGVDGTEEAKGKVKGVKDQIDGLQDRSVTVTVTTVVDFANELGRRLAASLGFARGGPIAAGLTAMVGEEGPELLVDRDDGRTRVIGADGPEMIRTTEPGFVIPNDKIRLGDGRSFAAGMLDNGRLNATFVHNGPVDASTVATLYGDDQVLLDKGRQSRGLLGRLAGRRAAGGPVEGGQPYLVGETGPELVVPGADSNVMSNQRLRQLYRLPNVPARQSGDVIVVNFHGPVASQRQAEDWVVSALASARRRGNRLAS